MWLSTHCVAKHTLCVSTPLHSHHVLLLWLAYWASKRSRRACKKHSCYGKDFQESFHWGAPAKISKNPLQSPWQKLHASVMIDLVFFLSLRSFGMTPSQEYLCLQWKTLLHTCPCSANIILYSLTVGGWWLGSSCTCRHQEILIFRNNTTMGGLTITMRVTFFAFVPMKQF